MVIEPSMTDEVLAGEFGQRIRSLRLARNLSRNDLAREAGLPMRTLQRLENGEAAVRLTVFLRACRALGLLEKLDMLLPEQGIRPLEAVKYQGAARQRASRHSRGQSVESLLGVAKGRGRPGKAWTWGDEK